MPIWTFLIRNIDIMSALKKAVAAVAFVFLSVLLLPACSPADSSSPAGVQGATDHGKTQVFRWKLVTTWPKNLPGLGLAPERFADSLRAMSDGRLDIKVYGAGELVGAFEVFDAVSQGTAQLGHGASYYWRGKIPVAAMFSTVPFGMTAQEMNGWLHYGGGLELWQEVYRPFGLIPLAAGNTGVQMAGWFNKEINSLEDLQGLKMRIPGLGGEVLERAGGTAVSMPGGEVFTALQTGVIDATEWVGPYNDRALGLHTVARYYYYPGWHEPGATTEVIINAEAWQSLPTDLQVMVTAAARAVNDDLLSEFTIRNAQSLKILLEEHDVELRRLPDDVLARLQEAAAEVVAEIAEDDELAQRVHDSYTEHLELISRYHEITEKAYINAR
jgi:TRAP-type mannitol/chloroaromatic compound transport system substrate-binding protein